MAGRDANKEMLGIREHGMAWGSQSLIFNVREPYPSRSTEAGLVFGRIAARQSLSIRSLMPENGVIFSDGMEADGLDFRSGLEATVAVATERGRLLI